MLAWPALISVSQFVEGYLHQVGVGAREVAVGRGRGRGALPGLLGEHGVHQGRASVLSSALARLRPVLLLVLRLVTLGHRGVAGHRPDQKIRLEYLTLKLFAIWSKYLNRNSNLQNSTAAAFTIIRERNFISPLFYLFFWC